MHADFLAHLWRAYAAPVALSVICRPSCVVCVHHKITAQKPNFHISTSPLKPAAGASFMLENSLDLGHYNLLKL